MAKKDEVKKDDAAKKTTATQADASFKQWNEKELAQFLPEGFSLDDFESVGGLRPICPPQVNAGSPVVGYVVALLDMPPRKADQSNWQGLLIHLLSTAQAEGADGEIIEVAAGKEIIIPVGGNLKVNSDLLNAAVDPRKVTAGIFTVVDTMDVGKQSLMWVYDVKLALKKQIPREGAFALYHKPAERLVPSTQANGGQQFAQGQVIGKDGKPMTSSLVG